MLASVKEFILLNIICNTNLQRELFCISNFELKREVRSSNLQYDSYL